MYNIGYRERNRIAQELSYNAHIDTDKDLLRRYAPKSSLLVRTLNSSNGATLSYDIIYTLLQYCTKDEIIAHRKAAASAIRQEQAAALQEDAGQESQEEARAQKESAGAKKKEDQTGGVPENQVEEPGGPSGSEGGADILGQGEPAPGSAESGPDAGRESDPGDGGGDGGEVGQEQAVL